LVTAFFPIFWVACFLTEAFLTTATCVAPLGNAVSPTLRIMRNYVRM
jgi:hypothetical protein